MKPNEIIDVLRDEYLNDLTNQIGTIGLSDEYPKTLKTEASIVIHVLKIIDTSFGVEYNTVVLAAAPRNLEMSDDEISDEIINNGELTSPVKRDNIRIGRYDEN